MKRLLLPLAVLTIVAVSLFAADDKPKTAAPDQSKTSPKSPTKTEAVKKPVVQPADILAARDESRGVGEFGARQIVRGEGRDEVAVVAVVVGRLALALRQMGWLVRHARRTASTSEQFHASLQESTHRQSAAMDA